MFTQGLSAHEVTQVLRTYGALMRRRALVMTRSEAMADDVVQNVCLVLMRRGGAFREAEKPLSWLYRAVETATLDEFRRTKRHKSEPVDVNEPVAGAAPAVTDLALRSDVLGALRTLEPRDVSLAMMAFVDGATQAEIGEELGLSRVTINKKVQALRGTLARLLHPEHK